MQTAAGRLHPVVGIDRTRKSAVTRSAEKADRRTAREVPRPAPPGGSSCRVRAILTDSGIRCAGSPRNRNAILSRPMRFDMIRDGEPWSAIGPGTMARGIGHRLTKPTPPGPTVRSNGWTPRSGRRGHSRSGGSAAADRETLPLRQPGSAAHPARRLHGSLHLRISARDPRRPVSPGPMAHNGRPSRPVTTAARSRPRSRIDSSATRSTKCRDGTAG